MDNDDLTDLIECDEDDCMENHCTGCGVHINPMYAFCSMECEHDYMESEAA